MVASEGKGSKFLSMQMLPDKSNLSKFLSSEKVFGCKALNLLLFSPIDFKPVKPSRIIQRLEF
jgi:hypothetical protein